MNYSNLRIEFLTKGEARITKYEFGNSEIKITWHEGKYNFEYKNQGTTKIQEFSNDLQRLLRIQIEQMYEAFDIGPHEIQSTIWSIQEYLTRKERKEL